MTGQDRCETVFTLFLVKHVGLNNIKPSVYRLNHTDVNDNVYNYKMEKRGYRIETAQKRDYSNPPHYPMKTYNSKLQNTVFVIYKNDEIIYESPVLENSNAIGIHSYMDMALVFQDILEK